MADVSQATGPLSSRVAGAPQGMTLAVAGFLPILSILSLAPAIPTLIGHFHNLPNAIVLVPLLATTPGLMVALLAPAAGWIADRFGRRLPFLIATSLYAFAGTAPMIFDKFWQVLASRLAVGLAETFVLVIVNALFADYYSPRPRRTWITVQGLIGPALGAVSIAMAGYLASLKWNMVFLIYLLALPVFVSAALFCFEPPRAHSVTEGGATARAGRPFSWRLAMLYCSVTLFSSIIYYVFTVQGGQAFHAIGLTSAAAIGAVMGPLSLGVLPGSLLFNFLSRRLSSDRLIAAFLAILGVGTIGMGISHAVAPMAAFGVLLEIGAGMTVTGLIFWTSHLLPPEHRGRGFGLWSSAFFCGQFVSPAIVGEIAGLGGGILFAFQVMGIVSLVGALIMLALGSRLPRSAHD